MPHGPFAEALLTSDTRLSKIMSSAGGAIEHTDSAAPLALNTFSYSSRYPRLKPGANLGRRYRGLSVCVDKRFQIQHSFLWYQQKRQQAAALQSFAGAFAADQLAQKGTS